MSKAGETSQNSRRAQIGQERRNRTRDRLIQAALQVIAKDGLDIPVIDDFIQAAKVSRGTFYNYYRTKEELFEALGERLNAERVEHHNRIRAHVSDAAERLVVGVRLNLRRAKLHPDWARVYAQERVRAFGGRFAENQGPKQDLINAMEAERLPKQPVNFALAMFYAVLSQAIALVTSGDDIDDIDDDIDERVAAFILAGLGMPFAEARAVASRPLPEDAPEPIADAPKPRRRRRRAIARPAWSE